MVIVKNKTDQYEHRLQSVYILFVCSTEFYMNPAPLSNFLSSNPPHVIVIIFTQPPPPPSSISHPIHPYPYLCIIVVISLTSMLTISSGVPFQNMCLLRNNCNLYTYIVICIFALMLPAVFASPRINLMFIFYHMLFISVLCCMPFCNIRMS